MNPNTIVEDLKRMIRFNTVSSRSNAALAVETGNLLSEAGFEVSYQSERVDNTLYVNVLGRKGKGGRPLLLCSHLDTVPGGHPEKWTRTNKDPWNPSVRRGRVYGLGSADDKASMIAMIYAGAAFPARKLRRPLLVMGTYGEENGMGGARLFTKAWRGPKPVLAIAGEPTSLGVTYRHKGIAVIVIDLETTRYLSRGERVETKTREWHGRSGHSSRPWTGENALEKAVLYLNSLKGAARKGPLVDFRGGHAANIIPDRARLTLASQCGTSSHGVVPVFPIEAVLDCYRFVQDAVGRQEPAEDPSFHPSVLTSNFGVAQTEGPKLTLMFDFRLLPGQSGRSIFNTIRRAAGKLSRYSGLRTRVWLERDNPPLDSRLEDPAPQLGIRLLRKAGLPVRMTVKPACTEGGIYEAWGVPAFIAGPGESAGNIHSPNECVPIGELRKAVEFYKNAIREVCVRRRKCF